MATRASTQGYDISNTTVYSGAGPLKPNELETLTCPSCKKILKDPMQVIACGHRFCRVCVTAFTSGSEGPFSCPIDGETFEATEIRNDKGCHKEICGLEVDCPTSPSPCHWRGRLVEIELHVRQCPNVGVVCDLGCGAQFPRSHREQHTNECPKRLTSCSYCGLAVSMDTLQDHYLSCEGYPASCDYCRKDLQSRKELTKHWEDECAEYEMICPLKKLGGCGFRAKRLEMVQHAQEFHTIQVFEKVVELQEQMTEVKSQNQRLHAMLKEKSDIIEKKSDVIEKLSERLADVEKFIRSGVELPDFVESDCPKSTTRPGTTQTQASKPQLQSQWHTNLVATETSTNMDRQKVPINRLREDMETQKSQLTRLSENMQNMQESVTRYAIAIDEVRLRQDVLDVKTTNGVFIWKIPDVRRRYRDAVERKTISLYSPPFYTSPHGYRMCVRAYLNGDGIGKGSHVSVFLVLMRSEHDSLLNWPFKQSVRFTLMNQVNSSASISEAFVPDLQSPSFQRPDAEMNIASGFPKFARQSILQDDAFTRGNVIFIKAKVDLTGLTLH